MRNPNGQQQTPLNVKQLISVKIPAAKCLTEAQVEFLDYILFHGVAQFKRSLKHIHDIALYYTDLPLEEEERTALHDLKILWEGMEVLER